MKQKFEEMIKAAMTRKYKVYIKKRNLINMDIDDDYQKSTVNVINESSQRYDSIAKYSRTIEYDKNCTIGETL